MMSKFLLFLLLLTPSLVLGQENMEHIDYSPHSLTFVASYATIPNSFNDNTNDILLVPAFGLNYDYQFNKKWGAGIHTGIILQDYKIETHGGHEEIERENPIAIAAIMYFKPHHRWKILGGYGIEVEKNESFQLIRIGVEYGVQLPKKWELGFTFENDYKINSYYTMLLGIGFTKKFMKQH